MEHYCEIEIKTKGRFFTKVKTQGLLFDMYAWFLLWQVYEWDFEAIGKKSIDELSAAMLYTGALSYNKDRGIKVDFTREQVQAWIDDIPTGKMKEIGRVLLESMKVLEPIQAAGRKVEEQKKK
jgi:hypothetical protein